MFARFEQDTISYMCFSNLVTLITSSEIAIVADSSVPDISVLGGSRQYATTNYSLNSTEIVVILVFDNCKCLSYKVI